jgi:hypothetical protein
MVGYGSDVTHIVGPSERLIHLTQIRQFNWPELHTRRQGFLGYDTVDRQNVVIGLSQDTHRPPTDLAGCSCD